MSRRHVRALARAHRLVTHWRARLETAERALADAELALEKLRAAIERDETSIMAARKVVELKPSRARGRPRPGDGRAT